MVQISNRKFDSASAYFQDVVLRNRHTTARNRVEKECLKQVVLPITFVAKKEK
jgi:hypothetical protein